MAKSRTSKIDAVQTVEKKKSVDSPPKLTLACDYSGLMQLGISNVLGVVVFLGWFLVLPVLAVSLPVLWYYHRWIFWAIVGLVIASSVAPLDPEMQPRWGYSIGAWALRSARQYFGLKLLFRNREAIQTSGPALFAIEPHDVLPLGLFSLADCLGYNQGHVNMACMTGATFAVPFLRNVFTWAPATSVDKEGLRALMRKGVSPTLCPGGVQEVSFLTPGKDECVLFLKDRKGFVKLAMEFGRPIVPMFCFGQRKTYDFWIPHGSGFWTWVGRKVGFLPMLFFGQFGIPLFIPKSAPLTVVVGDLIQVPKFETFSQADIDKYHGMFIDAMREIFESHKQQFGMENTELRIV
jgi:hypothetical protein